MFRGTWLGGKFRGRVWGSVRLEGSDIGGRVKGERLRAVLDGKGYGG